MAEAPGLAQVVQALFASVTGSVSLGNRALAITDVAFSRSGRELVVGGIDIIVFRRADARNDRGALELDAGNAAGTWRFHAPPDFRGFTRARESAALAVGFALDARDRIVSAWSDGTLRRGSLHSPAARHAPIAEDLPPVARVVCSPVDDAVAVVANGELILVAPDGQPTRLASVDPAAQLVFSPAGDRIAVTIPYGLAAYDRAGAELHVLEYERGPYPAGLAWTARGILTATPKGLVAVIPGDEPTLLVPYAISAIPGRLAISADGRFVIVAYMGTRGALAIFDLVTGEVASPTWTFYFDLSSPVAMTGDASAFVYGDTNCHLHLLPFGREVTADPDADGLQRVRALLDDKRPREALALLTSLTVRPGSQFEAGVLRSTIDRQLEVEAKAQKLAQSATISTLAVGNTVTHPSFGAGSVRKVEGTGDAAKVTVEFAAGVTKTLRASFLNRG